MIEIRRQIMIWLVFNLQPKMSGGQEIEFHEIEIIILLNEKALGALRGLG